jgi:predicted alpha/beta-hydrolase family hydrolase
VSDPAGRDGRPVASAGAGGAVPGARLAPVAVLLAPGAGAGRDQPALVAVDDALSAAGALVERMDFPYRRAGRRAPDRMPVLVDALVAAAEALRPRAAALVVGGRSMGGRVASVAVAAGLPAAGVVLVSYPLHPPGRPERPRTAHLGDIAVPCLFVSGTRDAFGTAAELEAAVAAVRGPVTVRFLEGGDHGLRGRDDEVAGAVAAWVDRIFPPGAGAGPAGADRRGQLEPGKAPAAPRRRSGRLQA